MFRCIRHLAGCQHVDTGGRGCPEAGSRPDHSRRDARSAARTCRDSPAGPIQSSEASSQVERKTISIMKACELVGVSRRTIYNWLSSGKIEYVRTAGGSVRIFVDTLWRDANGDGRSMTPPAPAPWHAEGRNQA